MVLAQVENSFKEKTITGLKENLIFSMISMMWLKILTDNFSAEELNKIQKEFISSWKLNITKSIQNELSNINDILNDENIDMINIISGTKNTADIEDYQQVINESIKEVEKIFWKICDKD